MAVCVVGPTLDSDSDRLLWACTVHCYYVSAGHTSCPDRGKPASATPLETTSDTGRLAGLAFWTQRTRRQRALVMHHGSWLDEPDHSGRDCWYRPDFFPAVEL